MSEYEVHSSPRQQALVARAQCIAAVSTIEALLTTLPPDPEPEKSKARPKYLGADEQEAA